MVFGITKLHLRFRDRVWAGKLLAPAVKGALKNMKNDTDDSQVTVLGIPRGGVIVADVVRQKISKVSEFDIVIPRKLGAPKNKEIAIGAIMEDGTTYLNEQIIKTLETSQQYLDEEKSRQLEEIKRRRILYLNDDNNGSDVQCHSYGKKIKNKVVILVDDGAATGSTIIAAARWIRKQGPKSLIIAIPVAPKETVGLLNNEADIVEVITNPPSSKFSSVGQFYVNFDPVKDEEVIAITQRREI